MEAVCNRGFSAYFKAIKKSSKHEHNDKKHLVFTFCQGSAFKGQQLARNNKVVVVTINYRLGAFGFLSNHTDTFPGNYGLTDQKIALKWVENHIHVS